MKTYELLAIFKPNLDAEETDKMISKINDTVAEFGGKVESTDKIGRKKLAYDIQNFRDGFFTSIVMELPAYHRPLIGSISLKTWERLFAFIKRAGTIIFASCVLIWFMSSYSWSLQSVDMSESILASIGNIAAPLFAPLGWGDWKTTVATVTGLLAKENLVGTLGILYGMEEVAEDGNEYWEQLRLSLTFMGGYSLLIFNLLCAPCFAAIGSIHREAGSAKWTLGIVAYQTILAYIFALIIYQFGSLIWIEGFKPGLGTIIAGIFLLGILFQLFRKPAWKTN